ncbi:LysR family transcriptional regulator [Phaeovulum sp. W22_SRMD_FR3]|uniref:LysR family transcriptional regulator n=1 Tax=Phaeovulum sp. W22_SRMD_FR3 TaxID=3240274 RepID=UPI003F9E7FFE
MDVLSVAIFLASVEGGSLAEAARRHGLPAMAAGRRLRALEAELGVRLLQRTTRSLALTPEGETFLPYARNLIETSDQARAVLGAGAERAGGVLRVSVSNAFASKVVAPLVPPLLQAHPDLRLSLHVSDTTPDLVSSGMDLAIRIANLPDSDLVATKLAPNRRCLVAAPAYLAGRGVPQGAADLAAHDILGRPGETHWALETPEGALNLPVRLRFSATSVEACHAACLAGAGIALLAAWNVAEEVAQGRLVALNLHDARVTDTAIWAVYPSAQMILPKVRVFVTALRGALQGQAG